jgi:hypothetical protein
MRTVDKSVNSPEREAGIAGNSFLPIYRSRRLNPSGGQGLDGLPVSFLDYNNSNFSSPFGGNHG